MKDLRFRVPVICQNRHRSLWYYEMESNEIAEIKSIGIIDSGCTCSKRSLGDGYTRDGEDQMCTGEMDRYGNLIFEGDIVAYPFVTPFGDIGNPEDSYSYYGEVRFDKGMFFIQPIKADSGFWGKFPIKDCGPLMVYVIGNSTNNPELLSIKTP